MIANTQANLAQPKKLRVGWFSFSCCEDSTILMTEMMNDHYQEWLKLIDFRHALILKSNNVLDELDVAFIEGAIASGEQEAKVKEIRAKSKKVVAVGACAVIGLPSGQRNAFDSSTKQEIRFLLTQLKYGETVKKLEDVIIVDEKVPGCPMNTETFLVVLNKCLVEFGIRHK